MKQIVLILFLCIVGCSFVWGQDANYYRNPDRIYLDSKDGHQGAFLWKMKKAGYRVLAADDEYWSRENLRSLISCAKFSRI